MSADDIQRSLDVLRTRHQPAASKLSRVQIISRIQRSITLHRVKPLIDTVHDMRQLLGILSDAGEDRVVDLLNIEHPLLPATIKAIEMIRSGQDDEQVAAFLTSMPPSVLAEEILEEFTMGVWLAIESFLELDRQLMAAHMDVQEEVEKQIRPRPRGANVAATPAPPRAPVPPVAAHRGRGRPTIGDPKQDAHIMHAWNTKVYPTHAALAHALELSADEVRKSLGRTRARKHRSAKHRAQNPG